MVGSLSWRRDERRGEPIGPRRALFREEMEQGSRNRHAAHLFSLLELRDRRGTFEVLRDRLERRCRALFFRGALAAPVPETDPVEPAGHARADRDSP